MDNSNNKEKESFKITKNWTRKSKKLKGEYPQLTDADLKFEQGKENDLIKRLESRLDKSKDEIIEIINNAKPDKIGF